MNLKKIFIKIIMFFSIGISIITISNNYEENELTSKEYGELLIDEASKTKMELDILKEDYLYYSNIKESRYNVILENIKEKLLNFNYDFLDVFENKKDFDTVYEETLLMIGREAAMKFKAFQDKMILQNYEKIFELKKSQLEHKKKLRDGILKQLPDLNTKILDKFMDEISKPRDNLNQNIINNIVNDILKNIENYTKKDIEKQKQLLNKLKKIIWEI